MVSVVRLNLVKSSYLAYRRTAKEMKSLKQFLIENLNLTGGTQQLQDAYTVAVRHILWNLDCPSFHREIAKLVDFSVFDFSPKDFRLKLKDFGYAHFNIKYYLLGILKTRKDFSFKRFEKRFPEYSIAKEDVNLCFKALESRKLRTLISQTARYTSIKRRQVYPKAFRAAKDDLNRVIREVQPHCENKGKYKLGFVTKYHGMMPNELVSELLVKAVSAYYQILPVDFSKKYDRGQKESCIAFEVNCVRQAISRYTNNIIKSYTAECRGRLVNVGSDNQENAQFILKTVNESQLTNSSQDEEGVADYSSYASLEYHETDSVTAEFKYSVNQILRKMTRFTKRKLIYKLLTQQSQKFEKWLEDNKFIRSKHKTAHDYFIEKPKKVVAETIGKYVNLSKQKVLECMDELTNILVGGAA